jgi:hypothetical protein
MKKAIVMLLVTAQVLSPVTAQAAKNRRVASGTYYDYMTIVTNDGNEWLLSDRQAKSNPYMKYNRKKRCYVARFKSGQKVTVVFDTRGTKKKTDDRIVSVKTK